MARNMIAVVVAERGTEWLGWARRLRAHEGSTIVLAQPLHEDDETFAKRVSDRIEKLEQQGAAVEQAAFIGADRADDATRALRSAVLRRLAALLSARGLAARLYVDAAARGTRATQRLMRALGWAIGDLAKGSSLKVLVLRSSDLDV